MAYFWHISSYIFLTKKHFQILKMALERSWKGLLKSCMVCWISSIFTIENNKKRWNYWKNFPKTWYTTPPILPHMHPFMQDVSSLISEFYMEPICRITLCQNSKNVRKSAQMCKIEVARGNQTNLDAQKVCFWCVSA